MNFDCSKISETQNLVRLGSLMRPEPVKQQLSPFIADVACFNERFFAPNHPSAKQMGQTQLFSAKAKCKNSLKNVQPLLNNWIAKQQF